MSEGIAPAEGGTAEEVEDESDVFYINDQFKYTTVVFDTETNGTVDVMQVGDRLGEQNDDIITVLRRSEVCEWFAEMQEEDATDQSKQMKQLLSTGADVPPALVSLAFHAKIASASADVVSSIERKQQRRELQERDRLENPNDEHPPLETVPDISSCVNVFIFQGFPATLSEVNVFQSPSTWLPENAISKTKPATLHTVLIVNSSIAFKRAASSEADKAPGKPDPKKAKGKGKPAGDTQEQQTGLSEALLKELDRCKQEPNVLNEIFVHRYPLKSSWFTENVTQTENTIHDYLFTMLEDLDTDLRSYHEWISAKCGNEIHIPPIELLQPAPKKPPQQRESLAAVPDAVPVQKAKGVASKKPVEEVVEPTEAAPSPEVETSPIRDQRMSDLPCHRKYYDNLKNNVPGCSVPSLLECVVNQVVRTDECRTKAKMLSMNMSQNPFDLEDDNQPCDPPESTVVESQVETELCNQQSLQTEKSLLTYVDFILGKVEGRLSEVMRSKKQEHTDAIKEIEDDLRQYAPQTTALVSQYRLGSTAKVVQKGDHFETIGTVTKTDDESVELHLATGESVVFARSDIVPVRPLLAPDGVVSHSDTAAVNRIGFPTAHINNSSTEDIDLCAVEGLSVLVPEVESQITLQAPEVTDEAPPDMNEIEASLPPQHVSRQLILFALEQLYDEENNGSGIFTNRVYTEVLDRRSYLQQFATARQLEMSTKSAWYDKPSRQALVIHSQEYDSNIRYRWQQVTHEMNGRVYFSNWMEWQNAVKAFERPPDQETDENEEVEECEEQQEGEPTPSQEQDDGTDKEADQPEEVVQEATPPEEKESNEIVTPATQMKKMREKAKVEILKQRLQPGPAQYYYHTMPQSIRYCEEQRTTLYPSDGGIIRSSVFEGNSNFTHCTCVLPDVTAGMRTNLVPSEPTSECIPNPTYFTAAFGDNSTFYVGSKTSEDNGNDIVCELSLATGLHTRVHSSGVVDMMVTHDIPANLEQSLPEGDCPEGEITIDDKVLEPASLVGCLLPESHPNILIQVYNEATNTVTKIATQELTRRVTTTGSVIRTTSDGTTSTLSPDGTVSTLYHGSWLITRNNSRHVIRRGTATPVPLSPGLIARNKDTETKAFITTRDDLTLVVEHQESEGVKIVAFSDGTSIWSKRVIEVVEDEEGNEELFGISGTYTPSGRSREGALLFINSKSKIELGKNDSGHWEFSTTPPIISQHPAVCPSEVTRWLSNSRACSVTVSSLRQARIESPSHASVEISQSEVNKVLITLPGGTILQWSQTTKKSITKETAPDGTNQHIPSKLSHRYLHLYRRDNTTVEVNIENHMVTVYPINCADRETDSGYRFDLLHGLMTVTDSDSTQYYVTARGNVRIKPLNALAENHPEGSDDSMKEAPVCERFSKTAIGWEGGEGEGDASNGVLISEPPQHVSALTEGGLKSSLISHPPRLYLIDFKKGIATRYLSPEDVVSHIRFASDDAQTSLSTCSIPGLNSEEITTITTVTPNSVPQLTEKLLPRVVLETQQNARRQPKRFVTKRNISAVSTTTQSVAAPDRHQASVQIRRQIIKHTEMSEKELQFIRHNLNRLQSEEVVRKTHAASLKVNDTQTEDELKDEAIVEQKLNKLVKQVGEDDENKETCSSRRSSASAQPNSAARENVHTRNARAIDELSTNQLSYWHTEEGMKQAELCLRENEKYKPAPKQDALIPSPPPQELKRDASPHGSQSSNPGQVSEPKTDPLTKLSKLEPIVEAGPHKQSLDTSKVLLRKPVPSEPALSVFSSLCILLGEHPTLEKCRRLVGSSDFYLRVLRAAENRDFLPDQVLTDLLPYADSLQPDAVSESMLELAAVSNWVLSFIYYLEALKDAGGPKALGREPRDEESTFQKATTGPKDALGNPRAPVKVASLKSKVAHSDPNTGYISREIAVARTVRQISGSKPKRVIQNSLSGKRVVLEPLSEQTVRAVITPSSLDFGKLVEGSKYTSELTITNVGQLGVRFSTKQIVSETLPSDAVSFVYKKGPIAPGMSCKIQVILKADRLISNISETIVVVTETAIMKIPLTAQIRPGSEGGTFELRKSVKTIGATRLPAV
eukprot:TRINITY_DN2449_c1_g1_i1.p1 TRINITY_DN2449_c1_g1~~TRINITY_DN2449_c1_g1_i1.p1  ORF type:complete len:2095 (+),score=405.88 TRINITY_DN2449_c1_g1_i1:54-6287(+)